jgi:hypothetical protein
MEPDEKARENRARRAAARQGLRLEKNRMRDPRGLGYGTYQLAVAGTSRRQTATRAGLTLDEVEAFLRGTP